MRLSTLAEIPSTPFVISNFNGYNHGVSVPDGQFYDMKNLASDYFPVLAPRRKRGTFEYPEGESHSTAGMTYKNDLCYVDNRKLYVDGKAVKGITLSDTPKQLISMGAYIIIMPDKVYVNTQDLSDCGDIEATFKTTGTVTYQISRVDGTVYSDVTVSDKAPEDPKGGQYWIDTSTTPHSLKVYADATAIWSPVATTYIRISGRNIAKNFKQWDGVKISGITAEFTSSKDLNDATSILYDLYHDEEEDGKNDYIVVVGFSDTVQTQSEPLTLSRYMPDMDFIVESNNRLWGCRYGLNANGDTVNEIYASKLGDFKNWNSYLGISTDSYTASCGTDGEWTGAISYLGYPLFFKENYMHKVYGNYPANYQIQSTPCRGVMKGAGKSLAIVNENLFYKSRNGVCMYNGSLPMEISQAFGKIKYSAVDESLSDKLRNGAVAGAFMNKYYISMKSEQDQTWNLFVYDTDYGMWHREDETRVDQFCAGSDEMYYIDSKTKTIRTVCGSGKLDEDPIEWMVETGIMGMSYVTKKYVSKLIMRIAMEVGTRIMFYIQYDSMGEWEHVASVTGTSLRSFSYNVKPKRCDHFRLRIIGRGDAKIYSITKTIEQGSDL